MRKVNANVTPLRARYDPTAVERQKRYREKQKLKAQQAKTTPSNATDDVVSTPAPTPPADETLTGEPRNAMPAAINATYDALSNFVDQIEYTSPKQVTDAMDEISLMGLEGDAKLAAEWLIGVLNALAATRR